MPMHKDSIMFVHHLPHHIPCHYLASQITEYSLAIRKKAILKITPNISLYPLPFGHLGYLPIFLNCVLLFANYADGWWWLRRVFLIKMKISLPSWSLKWLLFTFIDTWIPTDDDLNELPHVAVTSPKEWDPQRVSFPCSSDLEDKLTYSYDV